MYFAANLMKSIRLVGECNRCGICCVNQEGTDRFICENLEMTNLGQPNGTRCTVYDKRYNGMPILMYADDGRWVRSLCMKDSAEESQIILDKGIGKGCSLTVQMGG